VYADLVTELDNAAKAFDASKPFKGDVTSYNGDRALWKKAAYSLMLRIGMRLSKIEPVTAQSVVATAVAGGLISSYTESFRINHLATNYDNPNSHVLGYYNGARSELSNNSFKFSKTFFDLLTANADPRLKVLFVVRTGPSASASIGTEDDNPAIQKGLPIGVDPNGFTGIETYSQLRSDFAKGDVPNILVSHGETLLLLAEARERGWISTSTAEQYFRDGVNSSINQWQLYNAPASLFNAAAIDTYTNTTLAFPAATADRLQAINEQYYISTLLDEYESHANWRRSGYPVLVAATTGGYSNGVIPRRFQYPSSESSLNGTNLKAAITKQGTNNWVTRVWWDR
jgi:hypothetical protein